MELKAIQGGGSAQYQQQAPVQQNNPEQQTQVAREAEMASAASLQAYRQQSQQSSSAGNDTVQLKSSSITKNLDAVKAIEQMHVRLNDLVKGVRQTNEDLNKVAEQVGQLQGNLLAIVKNFPPYPIESMERRELLMSYMSLRKEIESLMIPPPPQPVYERVKTLWESMFAQNGQMQPGAVPALETSSSDQQVAQAGLKLDDLHGSLSNLSDQVTQALLQP